MATQRNATTIRNIPLGKFLVFVPNLAHSSLAEFTLETHFKTIYSPICLHAIIYLVFSSRMSPTRNALAMIVSEGFTAPLEQKNDPSTKYKLSTSCARQSVFNTLLFGSVPNLHVPFWWPTPSSGIRFLKIQLMWNHMRSINALQYIGPAIHKASERLHIVWRVTQLNSFAFNPLHAIFGGWQIL